MAIEKEVNIKINTSQAQSELNNLQKSIDSVDDSVKDTNASTQEMGGTLDKVTGGAITKFRAFKGSLASITKGFKTLRLAVISTGIGALVIAVTSLIAAFKGSEEGQNKFAKIMTVIGTLTGNLVDLLADLGEGIISVFENPKKAINDFVDLLKRNIINRFEGLLELVPKLGKAINLLFQGEFTEAGKVAGDAVAKVALGVDDLSGKIQNGIDKTKEFIKEQLNEAKAAASVADMRAKADKIERQLIIDRSKLESKIANLRLKSRQEEEFSAAERKQALLDAQKLEDELLDKETEFLELRRDAQILENTFSRSNKENLTKEAEAIAAVNRQQAARANTARQVQREVNTITKQIEAENKAKLAEEKAEAKALADFKKTLRDAEAISEQEKRDLELIKIQEHYDNLIAQAEANNINTDKLEEARDEAKRLKQEEFDLKDLETKKAKADKEKAIEEKALADKLAIIQAEQSAREANLATISSGLNGLQNVFKAFGKESKELAIAGIIVEQVGAVSRIISNTGIANAKAVAASPLTVGQPWVTINTISAAASIAGSIASAGKSISALKGDKKTPLSTTIPTRGASGGNVSAPSIPPAFNVVGASGTNQLAEAIGEQEQQPVQAYVVANDVTTAQSMDRNIVEGASIG